ncbi:MAG: DUF790 family protein [Myxococcota bacterium]|nr:DUF790 family protein [Myxococcota bacterium]
MLNRDLLMFRLNKGRIKPSFVDLQNRSLHNLARDLIQLCDKNIGQSRQYIEELIEEKTSRSRRKKISKGLAKLVLDRCEFGEPKPNVLENRLELFSQSAKIFRKVKVDDSIEEYRLRIQEHLSQSLDSVEEGLFADLKSRRSLKEFKGMSPEELLHRYNLAQVQGLILYAERVELTIEEPDIVKVRNLLRWLRFCRLVANISKSEVTWKITVDGPGSILSMQKKYGLQLAQFFAVVPNLEKYHVEAVVRLPRKPVASLSIDSTSGLCSHHKNFGRGHVPEEISVIAEKFESSLWELSTQPEPLSLMYDQICVPDFRFIHSDTGEVVFIELFHRWHRSALTKRLDMFDSVTEQNLVLGLDKALVSDSHVADIVEKNDQIFVFNSFPSLSKLAKVLKGFE